MTSAARPAGNRRHGRRAAACALLAAVAVALFAGPALGHALVEATEPMADAVTQEAPRRVVVRFTEPVEAAFGAVRVYDTAGRRVDDGRAGHLPGDPQAVAVSLDSGLGDGTYTVSWRVVSADGHPIGEAFVFHVGAPGAGAEDALERMLAGEAGAGRVPGVVHGLARWSLFAGLALLIGGWAFLPLAAGPAGAATEGLRRRMRVLRAGWITAVAATLVLMVAQIAVAAGLPLHRALSPGLFADLAGTRFGMVALARLALLAVAAVAWRAGRLDRAHRLTALLALALAATPGLAGHAGALRPAPFHVAVDAVHLLAAGVWLGGLVLLLRAEALTSALVRRFSRVALLSVAVLVVTGMARSLAEVGSPRALLDTDYGVTLLVKLGVFVLLLVLAGLNRFWLQPRMDAPEAADAEQARRRLRRLVGQEVALGVLVLAVTAVLVNLAPAKVEAGLAGPFMTEFAFGEGSAHIVVDPNQVGENIVHITLLGPDARPMEVEGVTARFRLPAEGIGPIEAEGLRLGPGHFAVQGRQLSVPGAWQLEIVARANRFTDLTAAITVPVR